MLWTRKEDSADSHAEDTVWPEPAFATGMPYGLVQEAPHCVERLGQLGMAFDRDQHGLATTLEAAHSHRRVLHVQDQTGRALVDVLRDRVEEWPGLLHRRGVRVTQLLRDGCCCGVQVRMVHICTASKPAPWCWPAAGVAICSPIRPTPPRPAAKASLWPAAGAAVEDLEFVQFHPTAIRLDDALLSDFGSRSR